MLQNPKGSKIFQDPLRSTKSISINWHKSIAYVNYPSRWKLSSLIYLRGCLHLDVLAVPACTLVAEKRSFWRRHLFLASRLKRTGDRSYPGKMFPSSDRRETRYDTKIGWELRYIDRSLPETAYVRSYQAPCDTHGPQSLWCDLARF